MELVQLGDSGLRASRVGLGCNNFGGRLDLERTRAVVDAALDVGVTFFDTAEIYGKGGDSERFLGEALAGRRDEAVIATKFGWGQEFGDGSSEYVRGAIEGSLERLRTDYVDLYYLHKPDPSTPIADTLTVLDELVRAGKVRAIGCSNFSAEQLAEADRVARELGTARFTVLQNQYSLLERDDDEDVLPLCRELGVSYIPYFPLASGLLTGKYRRGEPASEGTRLAGREIADERFDAGRGVLRICGGARALAPRARHLCARVDARGRVDHRRCDEARASAGERCRSGRLLAALERRARRAREALTTSPPKPYRPHADRSRDRSITRAEGFPRSRTKGVGSWSSVDSSSRSSRVFSRLSPSPVLPSRRTGSRRRRHVATVRSASVSRTPPRRSEPGSARSRRHRSGSGRRSRAASSVLRRRHVRSTRCASSRPCSRSSRRSSLDFCALYEEKCTD